MQAQRRVFDAGRRNWLDDDDSSDDSDIAAHEAAHLVCGWLCGLTPVRATIEPGAGFSGRVLFAESSKVLLQRGLGFAAITCQMAGAEGERLFGGLTDLGDRTDKLDARVPAAQICPDAVDTVIDCARRAARKMLKANPAPLIAITVALLAKRSLDRDQIEAILGNVRDEDDEDEDDGHFGAPDDDGACRCACSCRRWADAPPQRRADLETE